MSGGPKVRLTYDNGDTVDINPNRPALLLALEDEYGVSQPDKVRQILWMCWVGQGRPGEFDAWVDQVADIDFDQSENGAGPKDPSPKRSQGSRSKRS